MSAEPAEITSSIAQAGPPRWSMLPSVWRALKRAPPSAWFGLVVIAIYFVVAVFAPLLAPYPEAEIVGGAYEDWGGDFLLGTDQLGRDMLSRLIFGARNTIGIAVMTTALSFTIGGVLGLFAAILGGWTDQLLARAVDILMAIPQLIFALMLLSIFGSSIINLILIIAVLDSTRVFRLTRAVAMNVVVSTSPTVSARRSSAHRPGPTALARRSPTASTCDTIGACGEAAGAPAAQPAQAAACGGPSAARCAEHLRQWR